ncbi:MAG: uracil-DNA glycosylase family protein [Acetobacteraceae bacterium]|nr:uracil-DNA glycosylase family protein [Acetobacteraceae bacterium]MBY0363544.1 uracil-DNA glycosylase family protein [Phreatobacter sp.]
MKDPLAALLAEIRGCAVCAAHLALGPRPIVQIAAGARLVIIGQAPGAKVHASGVPWQDDSGERLREWTGLSAASFYDAEQVALLPMGFCYPGAAQGADLPPRPECAPLWHARALAAMPQCRLTLLVGLHAQRRYLDAPRALTLTQAVRAFRDAPPGCFPLPHPSWRSTGWMRRNPWFAAEVLPALRAAVGAALG